MTITVTAIDSKFTNAYQADKPCFVVKNLLTGGGYSGQTNKWLREDRTGGGSTTDPTFASNGTATQADLSSLPIRYTYDNRAALYSSPDDGVGGMDNFWALYAARWHSLVTGEHSTERAQEWFVDTVIIKAQAMGKTNLGMGAIRPNNLIGVTLEISADTSFSTAYSIMNNTVYADESGSNPNPSRTGESRTIVEVIPHAGSNRYQVNGDFYARLRFFCKGQGVSGDFWTTVPRIGEVFVGERIQKSRNTNQPYATELSYMSNAIDFESSRGDIVRYVRSKGRRRFELEFTPTGSDSYGIDDVEQVKLLAKKTNQFTEPFFYIPKPYTEPQKAYFVYAETADFNLEAVGPFERSVRLSLVEIPPFTDYGLAL